MGMRYGTSVFGADSVAEPRGPCRVTGGSRVGGAAAEGAIARNQPALTKVVIDLGEPEFRRQLLKPLVFAGTWRTRRVGDPGQGGRHVTMTHSSRIVWPLSTPQRSIRCSGDALTAASTSRSSWAAGPPCPIVQAGWDEVGKTGPHSGLQAAGLAHGPDVPDLRGGSTGKKPLFP
jgi:hypothetical protein